MTDKVDTESNHTVLAGWIVGGVFVLLLLFGAMIGGGQPSTPLGKPVVGTQACKDKQLAYTRTLPDRPLYDNDEFKALAANIDDLCSQPADRITH
jgi:hypothetical protein